MAKRSNKTAKRRRPRRNRARPGGGGRRHRHHRARASAGRAFRRRWPPISPNARKNSASCRTCSRPMRSMRRSFRRFVAMYNDLMLAPSGLSKLEREMIAVAVSSHNRCYYCLVAHGAAVRQLSGDPPLGELMAMNYRAARLSQARARHARLRRQADRRAVAGRGGGPRSACAAPASPIAISGTSPPSPASSTCRTALRPRPTCGRTASITARRGDIVICSIFCLAVARNTSFDGKRVIAYCRLAIKRFGG